MAERITQPEHTSLEARTITLSQAETSKRLGLTESTLCTMRWRGDGPPYVKVGGRVRYLLTDLVQYLEGQRRTSTSDLG